jgi:hypothetical protein
LLSAPCRAATSNPLLIRTAFAYQAAGKHTRQSAALVSSDSYLLSRCLVGKLRREARRARDLFVGQYAEACLRPSWLESRSLQVGPRIVPRFGDNRFFPESCHFVFHLSSQHSTPCNVDTEGVVTQTTLRKPGPVRVPVHRAAVRPFCFSCLVAPSSVTGCREVTNFQ